MRAYCRAASELLKDYLKSTEGRGWIESTSIRSVFRNLAHASTGVYRLDGTEDYRQTKEYERLRAIVRFIRNVAEILEEDATPMRIWRLQEAHRGDNIYDLVARLIFEVIDNVAAVSGPSWTTWVLQHNTVWADITNFMPEKAGRIIHFKLRRILYEKIKDIGASPDFRKARLVGYLMNVLGVELLDRHIEGLEKHYPLHLMVLDLVKKNYGTILEEYPEVAKACLPGSLSYDGVERRIVMTYGSFLGREPSRSYLTLD